MYSQHLLTQLQPIVPITSYLIDALLHLAAQAHRAPAECRAVVALCREYQQLLRDQAGQPGQPAITGALAERFIATGLQLLPHLPPSAQAGMDRLLEALITSADQAAERFWHDLTRGKRFPRD